MPSPSHTSPKQISDAFIKELEAFKRGGYRFSDSGRELFEGTQREAFDAYLDGLKAKHREGYYEIPTGVGKTALFIAIIGCYLRATENIPDAPRVLIHEPTTDLVIQTAQSFADFMPDIARRIGADDDQGREIDWANSQIDVHYTGRRGAGNKPNVLITTYQGQAADQRKAPEKRIHNPADFGLVIHDEAHFLTGEKYGPAAVDKFKGAIQLGVTATPEYSKDKTVANKLGYRYYHLPLNTAIERGDLCHVRPIVLKTHLRGKDAINLERAREFFEQQRGQPLSKKQLEQLLNQEARNQAIIKAYFNGSHPDTDERFLGQTGMIFAGGITHCNDFILHTERVLNQPAYRKTKQWLREEGVALIAPIHSGMPKDGVEIDFGGQRRKCTKDEIKELHRQGKILLIISDQELKLGSDFPMDSFIVDAVDRFSVPDATQRMGRGFRVDRGDVRRNLPPNPDKSCVAINVIDETTHEMYEGTPHHPIHATEILNGAEHRPPGRRVGALTRFKNHPPEVSENFEALGFEFITRAEAIQDIAKRLKEGQRQFPKKTEAWWSISEMQKKPGGKSNDSKAAVEHLTHFFDAGKGIKQNDGSTAIIYRGRVFHMQTMQSGPHPALCFLGEDLINAGLVQRQSLPVKTDDWWSAYDIHDQPSGGAKTTLQVLSALKTAFESGEGETQPDGSVLIRHDGHDFHLQKMLAGSSKPLCFRAVDIRAAGLVSELPVKTDAWLSGDDIRRISGQSTAVKDAVLHLRQKYEAGEGELLADGCAVLDYKGVPIRMQRMTSGLQPVLCFFGADWARTGLVLTERAPPKTDEWWSMHDVAKKPGGGTGKTRRALSELTRAFEAGEGTPHEDGGVTIEYDQKPVQMCRMQSGSTQALCFLGNSLVDAGLVYEALLPAKTELWWSGEDLKTKSGGKSARVKQALAALKEKFEAGEGEIQPDGSSVISYSGTAIRMQKMRSGVQQPICFLGEDLIEAGLIDEQGLPLKTDQCGWWNIGEIKYMSGGGTKACKQAIAYLTQAFKAGEGEQLPDGTRLIPCGDHAVHVQRMRSGRQETVCFLGEDLRKCGLIAEPGRESLKADRPARTDLSPGSDHLKRTGRSRSGPED